MNFFMAGSTLLRYFAASTQGKHGSTRLKHFTAQLLRLRLRLPGLPAGGNVSIRILGRQNTLVVFIFGMFELNKSFNPYLMLRNLQSIDQSNSSLLNTDRRSVLQTV